MDRKHSHYYTKRRFFFTEEWTNISMNIPGDPGGLFNCTMLDGTLYALEYENEALCVSAIRAYEPHNQSWKVISLMSSKRRYIFMLTLYHF